mmetsp:Transcript_58179/g.123550  ORF Transcript_58179/g.123550 Transcript_58179/m.123550 type:complete len:114 (+) Transcript_58179:438-779(+)
MAFDSLKHTPKPTNDHWKTNQTKASVDQLSRDAPVRSKDWVVEDQVAADACRVTSTNCHVKEQDRHSSASQAATAAEHRERCSHGLSIKLVITPNLQIIRYQKRNVDAKKPMA